MQLISTRMVNHQASIDNNWSWQIFWIGSEKTSSLNLRVLNGRRSVAVQIYISLRSVFQWTPKG